MLEWRYHTWNAEDKGKMANSNAFPFVVLENKSLVKKLLMVIPSRIIMRRYQKQMHNDFKQTASLPSLYSLFGCRSFLLWLKNCVIRGSFTAQTFNNEKHFCDCLLWLESATSDLFASPSWCLLLTICCPKQLIRCENRFVSVLRDVFFTKAKHQDAEKRRNFPTQDEVRFKIFQIFSFIKVTSWASFNAARSPTQFHLKTLMFSR